MTEGPPAAALDLRALLATLDRHAIEYTVIGGVAVQVHGHRRTTKDLDIIPAPNSRNLKRMINALEELEARPRDIPGGASPTAEQLRTAAVVPPLTTRHGELHILRDVPGQLLRRMPLGEDPSSRFAVVVPPGAEQAALRVSSRVRALLSVEVFVADDDGAVSGPK